MIIDIQTYTEKQWITEQINIFSFNGPIY